MRHLVNGVEVELTQSDGVTVSRLYDRLLVRGPNGLSTALCVRHGDEILASYRGQTYLVSKVKAMGQAVGAEAKGEARAPMPGLVVEVLATAGDVVTKGQKLLVLEAMKMQQTISAPFDGTVESLPVIAGQQVAEGDLLAHVTPASTD